MIRICIGILLGVLLECVGSGSKTTIPSNDLYLWRKNSLQNMSEFGGLQEDKVSEKPTNRRLHGRHVCAQSKVTMEPVQSSQSYCKPAYHSYLRRCDKDASKFCTGYKVAYEVAYRPVTTLVAHTDTSYSCCPGWMQAKPTAKDCRKAICKEECLNGGKCTHPDQCSCARGWTGKRCETDIDECSRRKHACSHRCVNIPGSFRCECEEGYVVATDNKTCERSEPEVKGQMNVEISNLLKEQMDDIHVRLDGMEMWRKDVVVKTARDREAKGGVYDDRITSLAEQIAAIEQKIMTCSCKKKEEEEEEDFFPAQ